MKLEVLFPDLSNLYGDMSNIKYLQACAPDIEIVYTDNRDTPLFVSERVDMLYIGSMPESKQELAITRLTPHADRLRELIEDDVILLATGNALEIFGEYIADGERRIPALGFFPFHAERDMQNRHNSMFLGKFGDIKIVGNKAQFSFCYGKFEHPFIEVTGGYGINPDEKFEGVHYRNLFATYLLGPFLVLNPYFTKYLLRLMGHDDALAFEKEAVDAYDFRLKKLEMPDARFLMGEHG
jgi:CobQ-like glutamine amidotransferase family enzyme